MIDIFIGPFGSLVRGVSDAATSAQLAKKAAVEVDHTEETSEFAFGARLWKVQYCFNFGLERPDTLPKITYFDPPKAALACVHR